MMVQHHEKYEEIHGEDKIVMMDVDEHRKLHARLRKEGKCTIPTEELQVISQAAYARTDKGKSYYQRYQKRYNRVLMNKRNCITFSEAVKTNVLLIERIIVNPNTGTIGYVSRFRSRSKVKLKFIDI